MSSSPSSRPSRRRLAARAPALPTDAEIKREWARRRLLDFILWTKPDYRTGFFHCCLSGYLDRVARGEIKRLMVFAPPQHGKSEIVSRRFPAFALGRNPNLRVIGCSYNARYARGINRQVQKIIDDEPYRELFPGTRLNSKNVRTVADGSWLRNSEEFEVVEATGGYRAKGVGEGIVGLPADLIVIDDPIKGAEQAYSPTYRDKLWDWYTEEVITRQSPDCAIVLMHQRWHEDDLAGRNLRKAVESAEADQWTVVRFPGLAYPEGSPLRFPEDVRAEGEPLWPERYTAAFLRKQRAIMSPASWASVYDQNPQPLEGAHFREAWFGRWADIGGAWRLSSGRIVPHAGCTLLGILDPAASEKQTADYTAMMAAAITPQNDLIVLEVVRERLGIEAIAGRLLSLCNVWGLQKVYVEANGFQVAVAREARRTKGMPPVAEVSPLSRSKLVRATEAIARAAAGQVYLADQAQWVPAFVEECVRFTGREGDRDDQVDCLAYAAKAQSGKMDQGQGSAAPYMLGR